MTTCKKIPYFNAPIYFENKEMIGKIDEIFGGPMDHVSCPSTPSREVASNTPLTLLGILGEARRGDEGTVVQV